MPNFNSARISDPSRSIDEVNVPEVSNFRCDFVYNFYTKDERVSPYNSVNQPPDKAARYITLTWQSPRVSSNTTRQKAEQEFSISRQSSKIVSEDNFFDQDYLNYSFSSLEAVEQGASDLENISRLSRYNTESLFQMARRQIAGVQSETQNESLKFVTEAYAKLADIPQDSLGLRVYDASGKLTDSEDLLRTIVDTLTIRTKIHSTIIPDVFKNSVQKESYSNLLSLQQSYSNSFRGRPVDEFLRIDAVDVDFQENNNVNKLTDPVNLMGYVIDRYSSSVNGFTKENTFYIEDIEQTNFIDREVIYGKTYVYTIRVVAAVKILVQEDPGASQTQIATVYVSSRPISAPVECFEYTPPPPPTGIRFSFDYKKRNLIITWDTPLNPQRDIKQFQVFRRKSIREPFELIAQYGFDRSEYGQNGTGRYKTGERVDANDIENMLNDDLYLVKISDHPVLTHVDEDFTLDPEFFVSSEYIYALASVDAHGMISNYSEQHHVVFDPYKNKLVTRVICNVGSPRQYPNMNLRMDAFKDTVRVSGDAARQLKIYFTPEYLKVKDDVLLSKTHKIVEAQTATNKRPYYLLQLVNLDNQKMQSIKIDIDDPNNLTG